MIKVPFAGLSLRTRGVFAIAAANYLARFGSVLVILITIPMARDYLGPDRFGAWMMISSLIGFMGFADLGLGNGALNRLTAAFARNDKDEFARVFSSTFVCMTGIGFVIVALWLAWNRIAGEPQNLIGKIEPEYTGEALLAFSVFFVLFAINLPMELAHKAQLAAQKGYIASLWGVAASLATVLAIPLVIYLDQGLVALVLASFGMTVLANIANTIFWLSRDGKSFNPQWRHVDPGCAAAILKLGLLFFGLQLAAAFAFQSDGIVISQTLGISAYGDYAAIQKIFLTVTMLMVATFGGLWPAFGNAIAHGDIPWVKRILTRSLIGAGLAACLLVGVIEMLIGPITAVWLGLLEPPSALLCWAFGVWAVVEVLGTISGSFLNAAGIVRIQLFMAILMGATAFAGKWLLVPYFGVAGAVIATLIAYVAISVPFQLSIYRRHIWGVYKEI